MAHTYAPGLKVAKKQLVTKRKILPLKGEVIVSVGDKVEPDTVVARTMLPGAVDTMNVANILGVPPEDVPSCMLKQEGERIEKGEAIAMSKSFFGLFKSEAKAKADGTVETISHVTGQVLTRGNPRPVEVKGYLRGEIVEVIPEEGVEVCCLGSFVQGIFGIGGETHGPLKVVVPANDSVLNADMIDDSCKDCILLGGSLVTADAVRKAIKVGAAGIVTGGFSDKDLRDFLGYDIGVAITGSEELGITLVFTEGFGEIMMAGKTFDLLKSKEGQLACMNGATQIRAGVIRPEVIIPLEGDVKEASRGEQEKLLGLEIGTEIRIIRVPYFGRLAKIIALPSPLQVLDSGSKARVLEVEFADGERAIVPRANVETIDR